MGLAARTLGTLHQYWADQLGVSPSSFEKSGVTVGSIEEDGVQVVCRDDALVIGASHSLVDSIRARLDRLASRETETPTDDVIREWLSQFDGIERVLGPTFYGYADRETFVPVKSDAHALTAADTAAFRTLQRRIPAEEWDAGGPQFTPDETVGVFVGEELVSVAGFEVWDEVFAHLRVVTHPDHRNRGYGQVVVSEATVQALGDDLIPQYRTLDAWPWSVELARNLGFHRFMTAYRGFRQ